MESSKDDIVELLRVIAAHNLEHGADVPPMFLNVDDFHATIDSITAGVDTQWHSAAFRFTGPIDDASPAWKRHEYVLHFRKGLDTVKAMVASTDFNGKFDYVPYEEYIDGPSGKVRRFSNLMSGQWAHNKAVRVTLPVYPAYSPIFLIDTDLRRQPSNHRMYAHSNRPRS